MEAGPTQRAPFGWGEIVLCAAIAYLGSALAVGTYLSVRGLPQDTEILDLSLPAQALVASPIWIGFGLLPLLVVRHRGHDLVESLGLAVRSRDIPLGLVIGVLCQWPGVPIVSWPLTRFFDVSYDDIEERARTLADKATGVDGVFFLVLMVAVMAPLAEEIFFRGMLQRTMLRSVAPGGAIILTAAIFAVTHFEPVQMPALFLFGVVLGVMTYRTGRLGMAWAAHVGFNLTTVVILLA